MSFQIGDKIQRQGPLGTFHVGIYLGWDGFGREWVIHNAKGGEVAETPLEAFAAGLPVTVRNPAPVAWYAQQQIAQRARSLLGKKYDLLNFNCDHFANYAQTGIAFSPQLRSAAGVIGIVALGIFAIRALGT